MELKEKCSKIQKMIEVTVQVLIKRGWKLPGGPTVLTVIERGLERMKVLYPYSEMADERIVDFIVYQIYRYRDIIGDFEKGWHISWCFSENAVERYKKQFIDAGGKSGMNYYIDQWLQSGKLDRNILTGMIGKPREHPLKKYIYMPSEELIKKRSLKMESGHVLCMMRTTGWSPFSETCQVCKHTTECIDYLEQNVPELLRLRREEKNENKVSG
jgi:hypothetical protein